jgi:D-alanyl-D-alanine dipeptidase
MNAPLLTIAPEDLIAMDTLARETPLRVDLVYAQAEHPENIFKTALYRPDAKLWLHKDFAEIVVLAAKRCFNEKSLIFVLKDGLRPVEAQEAMEQSDIVKANPHWMAEETRLLAPPGRGGHPRGMAVDVVLETMDGAAIDMGTTFDHLTHDPRNNPARRDCPDFPPEIQANRKMLEDFMMAAARDLNRPLLPLPSEWWDFRFPQDYSHRYAPIYDRNLPPHMRMVL